MMGKPTVLHANKYFYARAGAETVFFATRALLRERGHLVVDFAMSTDDQEQSPYAEHFARNREYTTGSRLRRAVDAAHSVYSWPARRSLSGLLEDPRVPKIDVAHLHNIYHQLTPSVLDELTRRQIPIVVTIHDWKLACPAYTLYRDGDVCHECAGSSPLPVLKHRCIKGSRPASAIALAEALTAKWRGSYGQVDHFVVPSAFGATVLAEAGVPGHKVTVIPNFLDDAAFREYATPPTSDVLYAGRLDVTKGVDDLLAAWANRRSGDRGKLIVAGVGPLQRDVEAAAAVDPSIEYLGFVNARRVADLIDSSAAVVLPARWEENCPMIVLEAQARGRAVICSSRGGLPDLVRSGLDGLVVPAGERDALTRALETVVREPDRVAGLGAEAGVQARLAYTADAHYAALLDVYAAVVRASS